MTKPAASGAATTPAKHTAYIQTVRWVRDAKGRSLHVVPTDAGRHAPQSVMADAWAQVVELARAADTETVRAQFDCHWNYARAVAPDKPSWNLEDWRPVVPPEQMVAARCNPGGPEE